MDYRSVQEGGGGKMTRLLVVDDHPTYRQGLVALLQKYEDLDVPVEAAGAADAIKKVSETMPDMVIMDINMKNGNGLQAAETICRDYPPVKVLILSVSDREEDLFSALRAGASAYVLKTATLTELVASIRAVAAGDSALSPAMANKLVREFRRGAKSSRGDLYALSAREIEILGLAARGESNKEIARACFISETTVKAHFRSILSKMEVKNRAGAVAIATRRGFISHDYAACVLR